MARTAKTTAAKTTPAKKAPAKNAAAGPPRSDDVDKAPVYAHRYCNARPTVPREFAPGTTADRVRAINSLSNKWVNGTELSYYFFDQPGDGQNVILADGSMQFMSWIGAAQQKDVVRQAFKRWADLGIGLRFEEVDFARRRRGPHRVPVRRRRVVVRRPRRARDRRRASAR